MAPKKVKVHSHQIGKMWKKLFGDQYEVVVCPPDDIPKTLSEVYRKERRETEKNYSLIIYFYFDYIPAAKIFFNKITKKQDVVKREDNIVFFLGEDIYRKIQPGLLQKILFSDFIRNTVKKYFFIRFKSTMTLSKSKFVLSGKYKDILSVPYFIMVQYIPERKKIMNKKRRFCAFVASSYSFERNHFFKKLSKYKKVDSYGKMLNNASYPKNLKGGMFEQNTELFQDYKFVICFENSFAESYITEKLPQAMAGNSIPVYRGAPDAGDYFNTDSFINYENYEKSYDKMIEKIIELDKDEKKYCEFLSRPWLTEKNIKNIKTKEKQLKAFLKSKIVKK